MRDRSPRCDADQPPLRDAMQLTINLNPQEAQTVQRLRQQGVSVEALVRDAIRQAPFDKEPAKQPRDVHQILDDIFAAFPDPPDLPPMRCDPHDRQAVQQAAAEHFSRPSR